MIGKSALLILLLASSLFADGPQVGSQPVSPACLARWQKAKALRALDQWSGLAPLTAKQAVSEPSRAELGGWSTDLLLHLVLVLEQEMAPTCPELPLSAISAELQGAYLKHLGLDERRVPAGERDTAFRAFLATREDHPALAEKLKTAQGKTALELAKSVYGYAQMYRGSVLVATQPVPLKVIDGALKALCPVDLCSFWDKRAIYKVLVTEHGGLAAYVPETASLVLSRPLLADGHKLHRLVLIHELAHAAARKVAMIEERAWVGEFTAFSGWGVPGLKAVTAAADRGDALGRLSKKSSFTLLPDPVITATEAGGKIFEGFPLGRTFARVAGSGDTSEDLADSIAAYVVAPERFCYKNKPLAPGKYAWVGRQIFGKEKPLACAPAKRSKKK